MYIPYALLTLEKSLLTIKSIVKSLKIDPESTLQHLTLGPSTPGKFWIWAWYLSPFFKKKIALSYFMPIFKKKNHFLYKLNHTKKWFSDVQMYKQILNLFIRTNKGLWVNQRLISPPNINALCLGQPKRVPYCVYEGKLNV